MGGLDELDRVAVLVKAAEDAVDAVARIAIDAVDAVPVQPLEDMRADRLAHRHAATRGSPGSHPVLP